MNLEASHLKALIEDLNHDTFIEEPWSIEFVDGDGQCQRMGNGLRFAKEGIWVVHFDREVCEFPKIRHHLASAQHIIRIIRASGIVSFDKK